MARGTKVSTSRTSSYRNLLTGQREYVTRTYAHPAKTPTGSSRTSRVLATTGLSPWQPRRAAVTGWVLALLWCFGTLPALGVAFLLVSGIAAGVVWWRRSVSAREAARIAALPPRPTPGPVWCDHCADWTVHPTAQHAA